MYDALNDVRSKISELATNLLGDIPGLRIGIVAMGDYPQSYAEPYILKLLDFTTEPSKISDFVHKVEKTGGGDFEECYEVMLNKVQDLSWSVGYSHNLVVIGDAIPHPKGNRFNDLDWEVELNRLAKDFEVRVYSVQCRANSLSTSFYKTLAERSGGVYLELSQFENMKQLFMGLCYREATEFQYREHAAQIEGLKRSDSAQLLVPEDLDISKYDLSNDDVLKIHNAIHDPTQHAIKLGDKMHVISVGEAGCRYVRIDGVVFIEQNKEKDNKYARDRKSVV